MNYSLKAIFPRPRTDALLSKLAEVLTPDSARRIHGLIWTPATSGVRAAPSGTSFLTVRGINGVELLPFEVGNNYHFKLKAAALHPFYANAAYQVCSRPYAPGTCACLLTSLFGSEDYLMLEMTSQLEALSQLLETSSEIHALWRDFARDSGALAAYVDRESEHALMLFPEDRPIVVPNFFRIRPSDDRHYSIDLTAAQILESNGLMQG